jgi:C-terminal processing protease CtpA/Prc
MGLRAFTGFTVALVAACSGKPPPPRHPHLAVTSHDPDHRRGALPDAARRRAVIAAVRDDLDTVYAHRVAKLERYHLDEAALFATAEAALVAATTWAGYDVAIYDLLAHFHDGHLTYHPPSAARPATGWLSYHLGFDTALAGDHLLIAHVDGGELAAAGVAPGDEVTRIDGAPVADVLAKEVAQRAWSRSVAAAASWASSWTHVVYARGEAPRHRTLTIARRSDGTTLDVAVMPTEVAQQHRDPIAVDAAGDLVTLTVHSLGGGRASSDAIDAAMAVGRGAKQLVIDLRGVRGGTDQVGYRVVGDLVEGTAPIATVRVLLADRTRAARRAWRDLPAQADGFSAPTPLTVEGQPAGQGFHGRLAVVVDATCASTCEVVAAALRADLHAVLVGEVTAGNSGAPIELALPRGGDIAIPTWNLMSAEGHAIEDDGVTPDLIVVPTADALASGHDAALDKARACAAVAGC